MAVSSYQKDGNTLWKIYINIRSREDTSIREQKLVIGFESEKAALAEEKKLVREITERLFTRSTLGFSWEHVIDEWMQNMQRGNGDYQYQPNTIIDHVSTLRRWTAKWLKMPAASINRADAREIFRFMEAEGKSRNFQKNVKHTINIVYKWGIEERLIVGVPNSPVVGFKLTTRHSERVPDILTIEEIRKLLFEAKRLNHDWYPIWATAMLTGMRNGELHALLWSDVDLDNDKLTVSKSYNTRMRSVKSTKAGYWRTVPISSELKEIFVELKLKAGNRQQVLPRFWQWDKGEQARILRAFCVGVGVRSICFHALRACFATQLLANDIAPAQVMKVCGWRDLKTMQHYIRLAGIDERGVTQVLRVLPSDAAIMGEVVNLFDHKKGS